MIKTRSLIEDLASSHRRRRLPFAQNWVSSDETPCLLREPS